MSDDPTLPPFNPSAPEPTALKSLLNPIQSGAATPSSTIAEAPKSPQPPIVAPVPQVPVESSEANGVKTLEDQVAPTPAPAPTVEEPAVTSQNGTDHSLPPLPVDAPVPPSPKASDEPPPVLAPGAIPPAVSTPTVITEENPIESTPQPPAPPISDLPPPPTESVPPTPATETAAPASSAPQPSAPVGESSTPAVSAPTPAASTPAPSGFVEPLPTPINGTPAPTTSAAPAPADDSMDIDRPQSSPPSSLKRSGEDLEQGREEKRAKEDSAAAVPATETPATAPQSAAPPPPAAPAAPATEGALAPGVPAGGTVPLDIPPPPEATGPTTPLTLVQHKHLLGVIRSLKKNKDAVSFLVPVDPILFGIPHYLQYITNPMDLGTVETKLIVSDPRGPPKDKSKMNKWDESKGRYNSVAEVTRDVRQIWWNTARFNGTEHIITQAAYRLDAAFTKALKNMPAELPAAPLAPPRVTPSAAAGPSTQTHARRQSVSQVPLPRRTSDSTDRPKREIHPPPSKDLMYADAAPRKKRRSDPQLTWALKTLKSFETTNKTYEIVSPFLFSVADLIATFADYGKIIKKPMDLLIVKQKIEDGVYDDISQVTADINLVVSNALTYNAPQDAVAVSAQQLGQLWTEKLKSLPAKQEVRESSEDPLAASIYDEGDSEDEEDETKIAEYSIKIAELQNKIDELRAKQANRKTSKQKRPKKSNSSAKQRKQSLAKVSPSPAHANGNGKKARKPKDVVYKDEEDEEDVPLTTTQKSELAHKISNAEDDILSRAVQIIATTQNVEADGEIELDIDSLPPHVIKELYILVVGPIKKARKSAYVPTGKKPGRKPGGPRKSMNEAEEAERIARMQAQLQSFDSRGGPSHGNGNGNGFAEDDSESSEEEDSDLE